MIIKEALAFEFDCPMKLGGADVLNRVCHGKDCMGWRWAVERNPDYKPGDSEPWRRSTTDGYCGMAGQA